MKRTIPPRVLEVLLVSLLLAAPCQAEQKPEKLWKGMGPINDKYDWLRPPDWVLESVVSRVHSGLAASDDLMYEYKKRIEFDALTRVVSLWLETPSTAAARIAQADRTDFHGRPAVASMRAFRNYFYVMVLVQAFTRNDLPNVAILSRGKLIRPYQEDLMEAKPTRCMDHGDLPCWYNSRVHRFRLPEPDRLSGPGSLILRWVLPKGSSQSSLTSSGSSMHCTRRRAMVDKSSRIFQFVFLKPQRLSGSGHIILRWDGSEKQVPINFDCLW